ncbi:undecaprenyl-phosphate glucose phosphotransferase [Prolixibacteraceae bacterium Z1-6]|uniref:Undecaprenyl-phosphate glucose phosphotransferase n=1 Tax=Draconibacterium aestuarii TaxID=2998507 RepID=A0A9X3J559_9BACT|nr:undecaprenyl-phosphate glucose phosphotransferase [Prolixibacteraceae bacterium Z1-6]
MRSRETELLYIYLAFDLFLLNAALLLTAWISLDISVRDYNSIISYILHGNLAWVITYVAFSKKNLYLRDSFLHRIWRISKRQVIFIVVSGAIALIFLPEHISRLFFFQYCLLFYIGKIIAYWLIYSYLKFKRSKRMNTTQVAVVGCGDTGNILKDIIESNPNLGYTFSGFVCSNTPENEKYLGHPDNLEELIDKHNIHVIFYTISFFNGGNAEQRGKEVLKICNRKGVRLKFVPTNQQWFRRRLNMESMGDMVIINPQEIPLDNVTLRLQKRAFDLLFSALVTLLLLSWLFPILAIIIKLNSKGPVFFAQNRTGINNKTFKCLKFRSMKVNGSADAKQATANDDRITKVGRFLRKSNLDELPQFLNVLAGNMSVVGPRPHMLKHTEEYSALIDHYLIRHYVKPGITGWAQVKGYRGETQHVSSMEKRVNADMEYIENWTFTWDLKIIWLTVFGKKVWKNAG